MAGLTNAERCKRYYAKNKEKQKVRMSNWYQKNKDKRLSYNREYRYGITSEEVDKMFEEQGKVCKICQTDVPGGRGTWHVDHNHLNKIIRGILCHNCNAMLGHAKDNPELLSKAAKYLVS